jgi:hypothetical protein
MKRNNSKEMKSQKQIENKRAISFLNSLGHGKTIEQIEMDDEEMERKQKKYIQPGRIRA